MTSPVHASADTQAITLEPDPGVWRSMVRSGPPDDRASRFRRELGLPDTGPVVMTGHQADWWHTGVLAKYLALDAFAVDEGAARARLWVDQDTNDPSRVRYPAWNSGRRALAEGIWHVSPAEPVIPETPTSMRRPLDPAPAPDDLHPRARTGALTEIADALRANRDAPSLARQVAGALADLTGDLLTPCPDVFATDLARTSLFAELVERIRSDPGSCIGAYNDAVAGAPGSGLRPLTLRDQRVELPLWRIRPGEPRLPVFSSSIGDIPADQLAPRGPLMTGMMRLAGCDLFIHGTGGRGYSPVTERWFKTWLGDSIAPVTIASATCTLPLSDDPVPDDHELALARHRAHSARHNPGMLDDPQAADAKRDRLARIADLKSSGRDPTPEFRAMHDDLERYRERHSRDLSSLDAEADRLAALVASRTLIQDRTWTFALFDRASLESLAGRVRERFRVLSV